MSEMRIQGYTSFRKKTDIGSVVATDWARAVPLSELPSPIFSWKRNRAFSAAPRGFTASAALARAHEHLEPMAVAPGLQRGLIRGQVNSMPCSRIAV